MTKRLMAWRVTEGAKRIFFQKNDKVLEYSDYDSEKRRTWALEAGLIG